MTLDFETPSLADAPFERPRMVFSFGDKEDSYFIGCGEEMEWNNLPKDLDCILRNRALEVLAISLGESESFYCRYIAKRTRKEYTVTGNLPDRLEFLINAWWANQYEVPHITFGPQKSYFFQMASMTTWERLPKRLEETLLDMRESPEASLPPRALGLGCDGSFVLLGEEGETTNWDGIDEELATELGKSVKEKGGRGGKNKGIELAVLSVACPEDYVLIFEDGSIFYSVPDEVVPKIQRFVKVYHDALVTYNNRLRTARKSAAIAATEPSSLSASLPSSSAPVPILKPAAPQQQFSDPSTPPQTAYFDQPSNYPPQHSPTRLMQQHGQYTPPASLSSNSPTSSPSALPRYIHPGHSRSASVPVHPYYAPPPPPYTSSRPRIPHRPSSNSSTSSGYESPGAGIPVPGSRRQQQEWRAGGGVHGGRRGYDGYGMGTLMETVLEGAGWQGSYGSSPVVGGSWGAGQWEGPTVQRRMTAREGKKCQGACCGGMGSGYHQHHGQGQGGEVMM